MTNLFELLDLQRFAGEGGAAGATDGGSADTGDNAAQGAAAPADDRAINGQAAADTTERRSFEDLVNGEYKDDADKYVQNILKRRLKGEKALQARLDKQLPIMQMLSERYGIDASDPNNIDADALNKALSEDKALYEAEAIEAGVPVDLYMRQKRIERENAALRADQQAAREQAEMQREYGDLMQQAAAMQANYPDFSLENEMANSQFGRLVLKPPRGLGWSVEDAYYAVHRREIMAQMQQQQRQYAQQAVQQAQQKTANAIASGSRRPVENGVAATAASIPGESPRNWTKAERDRVRREVNSGKKIYLP
jgi:hypothetical protein